MTHSVFLDLDGTLIDSLPGILASSLATLRALGHEPDDAFDITSIIGPPLEVGMRTLLQTYGDDRVDEAVALYRAHYGEVGLFGSTPYPGIGEAMGALKTAGFRLYLATLKRKTFAVRILDHLDLTRHFDGLYGSTPGGDMDEKAVMLDHILSEHGLSPSRSLMVGDRDFDITSAHAVGMQGLGVLWGYGDRAELEEAGADELVATPADLAPKVISRLGRPSNLNRLA